MAEGQCGQRVGGNRWSRRSGPRCRGLFQNTIGSRFQFVPYRSAGLAIRDLVAGQIDMNLDTPATSGPLVRNGLIKGPML